MSREATVLNIEVVAELFVGSHLNECLFLGFVWKICLFIGGENGPLELVFIVENCGQLVGWKSHLIVFFGLCDQRIIFRRHSLKLNKSFTSIYCFFKPPYVMKLPLRARTSPTTDGLFIALIFIVEFYSSMELFRSC